MAKHILKIGFFIALAVAALGTVTMLLWNWLVPALFNGPMITFGETLGILLLSKILFGGWKGKRWKNHHCHSGKHTYWKTKIEERMANMTPEEREKFKQKYSHCGWNHSESTSEKAA